MKLIHFIMGTRKMDTINYFYHCDCLIKSLVFRMDFSILSAKKKLKIHNFFFINKHQIKHHFHYDKFVVRREAMMKQELYKYLIYIWKLWLKQRTKHQPTEWWVHHHHQYAYMMCNRVTVLVVVVITIMRYIHLIESEKMRFIN